MTASHQEVLSRVLHELARIPRAAAVAAYGSTATRRWSPESDLDLIVIVTGDASVNSVHFFVQGIPIDLNLKSRERWISGDIGWLPPNGVEALWDPDHLFDVMLSPQRSEHDIGQYRYAHRHRLLKLQRWIREDADVADLIAAGATHWIAVSYFHARGMRFPGIDQAVHYWREHDPRMIDLLIGAVKEQGDRLARIEEASELALSPAGGLWDTAEVHLTGWSGPPTADDVQRAKELLAPVLSLSRNQ